MKKWELLRIRQTDTTIAEGAVKKYLNEGYEPFAVSIEPGANRLEVIWLKREIKHSVVKNA